MTMSRNMEAYALAAHPSRSGEMPVEAWALTEAARRMAAAQVAGTDAETLLAAVRLNWRLWTILQVDLMSEDNKLPEEIRNNLLSLTNFIDKHTLGVLSEPLPERLDILISINRNIASGLIEAQSQDRRAKMAEAQAAAPAEVEPRRAAISV